MARLNPRSMVGKDSTGRGMLKLNENVGKEQRLMVWFLRG
jgi:hypothetical protein